MKKCPIPRAMAMMMKTFGLKDGTDVVTPEMLHVLRDSLEAEEMVNKIVWNVQMENKEGKQ